jgi:Flp pilus assembly pilin Flp
MHRFMADEHAQGMVEYALIISVIALFLIITAVFFKDQVSNFFSNVGNNLT